MTGDASVPEQVAAFWTGIPVIEDASDDQPARIVVFVVARSRGRALARACARGAALTPALADSLTQLRSALGAALCPRIDTLQIDVAHGFEPVTRARAQTALSNIHRGLRGLEIRRNDIVELHAPSEMIASNRSYRRLIELFLRRHGPGGFDLRIFDAAQWLVPVGHNEAGVSMFRGSRVVPLQAVSRELVEHLADLQAAWMFNNLQPDGRMVYKYWPSAGTESDANNMIRQWMATVAMGRIARRRADPMLLKRVESNIRYNLGRFYEDRAGLGCIVEEGAKVKLGAVALAALALVEHPDRERFAPEIAALCRTVDHLWQADGSFITFLDPPGRNDNQNFYPGEALLLWATLYGERPDPELLKRFMVSFRYYRRWHLENRNPAFIPWHTQAYRRIWSITAAPELGKWILEMNDWLLPVQQWDSQRRFPDTQGRFHDPSRPFGPPHASSTGVYLEGLIDAWRVARLLGDEQRREDYRKSMVRGLRSVAQLTFKDEVDMFYIARRQRVLGGVRTTVYNNEIRVDNVQHNLMAILEILDTLPAEDFRP